MADGPRTSIDVFFDPTDTELLANHSKWIARVDVEVHALRCEVARLTNLVEAGGAHEIRPQNAFAHLEGARLWLADALVNGRIDEATHDEALDNLEATESGLIARLPPGGATVHNLRP